MNPGDTTPRPKATRCRRTLNEGRGVNPGDTSRCCRLPPWCYPLNEGRGLNPGDTSRSRTARWSRRTLNEGRGVNPGDTRDARNRRLRISALNEGRGGNPGDTFTFTKGVRHADRAQRRPGREPRRHRDHIAADGNRAFRSTKAGAGTPATPSPSRRGCGMLTALNEGRGVNPGDTVTTSPLTATVHSAQRRPGREPRRHTVSPANQMTACAAQRRPGREPRRHFIPAPRNTGLTSAQRRPGREPRRHGEDPLRGLQNGLAQRRPGREPRRHPAGVMILISPMRRSTKAGA